MAYLEITDIKAKEFDETETAALKIIKNVLTNSLEIGDDVKIAMQTLNMVAKNRQTLTAREGIRFSMMTALSEPNQLKKYIKATEPEIRKALS